MLKRWFRRFVEVRDAEGAERCIVSAVEEAGCNPRQMADIMLVAATDRRYIDTSHPLDFTNKAFEALDIVDWGWFSTAHSSNSPKCCGQDAGGATARRPAALVARGRLRPGRAART